MDRIVDVALEPPLGGVAEDATPDREAVAPFLFAGCLERGAQLGERSVEAEQQHAPAMGVEAFDDAMNSGSKPSGATAMSAQF